MKNACILALVFLMFGLAHADVGPSPNAPEIGIHILENGEEYMGDVEMTYVCSTEPPPDVEPDDELFGIYMPLECDAGLCTNTYWFYKLNDCFYSEGVFEMNANGENVTSREVDLTQAGMYEYSFDVGTGEFEVVSEEPRPDTGAYCCLPGLMLALLPLAVFIRTRM